MPKAKAEGKFYDEVGTIPFYTEKGVELVKGAASAASATW